MIPPVAPSTLDSNLQFAALHRNLTTSSLNPDGSTRATSEAHVPISGALHANLLRAAKKELLRSSLRNIIAASEGGGGDDVLNQLPELRELAGTISILLDEAPSMNLNEEEYDLLGPDVDAFQDHLQKIAGAVSKDLQRQHDLLCKVASPSPSPAQDVTLATHQANSKRTLHKTASTISSQSPNSLPSLLQPLLPETPNPALQAPRTALSNTALQHSSVHRTLLTTTLTHLERTTHGLHARHTKARSAHLGAVAAALAKRIEVLYLQSRNRVYNVDVQGALGNYQRHLAAVGRGLEERQGMLGEVVREFDDVGMDGGGLDSGHGQRGLMREVGRRYGEILREIEVVKEEMAKLERSGGGSGKHSGSERARVGKR